MSSFRDLVHTLESYEYLIVKNIYLIFRCIYFYLIIIMENYMLYSLSSKVMYIPNFRFNDLHAELITQKCKNDYLSYTLTIFITGVKMFLLYRVING